MNEQKAKFTWHYYVMATGALAAMLAGTLGSTGGIAAGIALAIISHSAIPLKSMTRFAFMVMFAGLYVFSFPDPDVVREMMSGQHVPMVQPEASAPASAPVATSVSDAAPVVAPMTEAVSAPEAASELSSESIAK